MREAIGGFLCLLLFVLAMPLCFTWNLPGFAKALDALVNVCLFNGLQGETTSSHAGRWLVSGLPVPLWVKAVNAFTNLFEDDHCRKHILERYLGEPL